MSIHSRGQASARALERYVGLQPHEASNLSVLLYNADAAELPLATVRELRACNRG
jgi:S-DNA-T family DNA segregation ATPase FtsK/SpoIIIE